MLGLGVSDLVRGNVFGVVFIAIGLAYGVTLYLAATQQGPRKEPDTPPIP